MTGRPLAALAALATVAVLATAAPVSATAPAAAAPTAGGVRVELAGPVEPPAPDAKSVAAVPISVPLALTNTGDQPLYDVGVTALRGSPIDNRAQLSTALTGQAIQVTATTRAVRTRVTLPAPLAPGQRVTLTYLTDSSSSPGGLCLCFLGVYPVDLNVTAAATEGGRLFAVGRSQTYLASITAGQAAPVDVGWVWSLLDRPHRLTAGTQFTDDDLAGAVRPGGRLDRALATVEQLDQADPTGAGGPAAAVRLLLVLDPETIAELNTMTTGYTVATAGRPVAGTGGAFAGQWLHRLTAVVAHHDVVFTAPADPDLDGVAAAGLTYRPTLDDVDPNAIAAGLGLASTTVGGFAWPAGGTLTAAGRRLLAPTTRQLVLAGPGDTGADDVATVTGTAQGTGTVRSLLTDADIDRWAAAAMVTTGDDAAGLQKLLATIAMTAVANPEQSRFVLVTSARYPDVSPTAAARAIATTSTAGWTEPAAPAAALAGTAGGSRPVPTDATAPSPAPVALAPPTLAGGQAVAAAAAGLRPAIEAAGQDADPVLGNVAGQVQRALATAWRYDPGNGAGYTAALAGEAGYLTGAVRIVAKPGDQYSLASSDSPLLLTVANDLPVAVQLRVTVTTKGNVPGFAGGSVHTDLIPAVSRPTLRIPTSVVRTGQFAVTAALVGPGGTPVGTPVQLTVRSTAVGVVGSVITIGAAALLVLALLIRFGRRWRRHAGRAGREAPGVRSRP